MNPKVSIIMGSTSDLPIMEQAAKLLDEFEIPFEINALSAHRTPDQAMDFNSAMDDIEKDLKCISYLQVK